MLEQISWIRYKYRIVVELICLNAQILIKLVAHVSFLFVITDTVQNES